jgi:ABC-type multidrug transport system fused ATPase/permease subunit
VEPLKDSRTLIRNVLPGLAFILEFIVFAYLSGLLDKYTTERAWGLLSTKESSAIAIGAVTLFFASGAAGYVVANIYHAILNRCFRFFDYQRVLDSLSRSGHLRVQRLDGSEIKFDKTDYRRDWVIITVIWHERRDTNQQFRAATARAESLVDIAHGTGTLFVGSSIAWLIAFVWGLVITWPSWYNLVGLIGLLLVIVHWVSLRWTASMACDYVGTIVHNQVRYDSGKDHAPVLVFYSGK